MQAPTPAPAPPSAPAKAPESVPAAAAPEPPPPDPYAQEGVFPSDSPEILAERAAMSLQLLKWLIPMKNMTTCWLLAPVILGSCRPNIVCVPWTAVLLLCVDITVFSSHVLLAVGKKWYSDNLLTLNFYVLFVMWFLWNVLSHPVFRMNLLELFSVPEELHMLINLAGVVACCSPFMPPPSTRKLLIMLMSQLVTSSFLTGLEVNKVPLDWVRNIKMDVGVANLVFLTVGLVIVVVTTVASEKDSKFTSVQAMINDDLESRKRAVLTALCDAVLTTDTSFTINGSVESADRIFRRPMQDASLLDFFSCPVEKERFLAAVKRQFPEDNTPGEGPRRMRVHLHDENMESFEADIVVSDANTDADGKINKFMVGMHVRGDARTRAMEADGRTPGQAAHQRLLSLVHLAKGKSIDTLPTLKVATKDKDGQAVAGSPAGSPTEAGKELKGRRADSGDDNHLTHLYNELCDQILSRFDDMLKCDGGRLPPSKQPFCVQRGNCEVLQWRPPPITPRKGDRPPNLRKLSGPDMAGGSASSVGVT